MPTEKLYDMALKYKKTKLWNNLYDTELFALKLSNGKIGYCSVMGELGEHIALALYIGDEGLSSYRQLFEAEDAKTEMERQEKMLSQDCIQCSFENKDELTPIEIEEAQRYAKANGVTYRGKKAFPQFKRYRPSHYPWYLKDEMDEQLLYEAISAAITIAEMLKTNPKRSLGFVEGLPYKHTIPLLESRNGSYQLDSIELSAEQEKFYPSPLVSNELLVTKLKRKRENSKVWVCEAIMVPTPVSNETKNDSGFVEAPENAPFFPYMLLAVDSMSEMVIPNELVENLDSDAEKLVLALAHAMDEFGVPGEILIREKRTEILLSQFAKQIGTKIVQCDQLPILDEIEEDMLAQFSEQKEDELEQFLEMFLEMDDNALRAMPRELQMQMLELESQGVLPEPVAIRIRQLFI